MRRSVLVLTLLLASHVASAQPALTPPITPAPAPTATADSKDPSIAVLLSVGVTTAGYVTLIGTDSDNLRLAGFAAVYLGPSTGQWYAGQVGALGLGLRAVGLVSAAYGFVQMINEDDCDDLSGSCSSSSAGDRGAVFFFAGAGLWVGSSIYDVVLAKRAADSWNARHHVNLAPMMTSDASGNKTPGLVLTGRF